MPETRPGRGKYAIATKAVLHGAPAIEKGFAGVAFKQKVAPGGTGLGSSLITTIAIGEQFFIQAKGLAYVDNPAAAFVEGAPVYITDADNTLVVGAGAGISKFGRCYEVAGQRGVGTGKMRVDLDARDSF